MKRRVMTFVLLLLCTGCPVSTGPYIEIEPATPCLGDSIAITIPAEWSRARFFVSFRSGRQGIPLTSGSQDSFSGKVTYHLVLTPDMRGSDCPSCKPGAINLIIAVENAGAVSTESRAITLCVGSFPSAGPSVAP